MLDNSNQSKKKLFIILGAIVFVLAVAGVVVAILLASDSAKNSATDDVEQLSLSSLGESLRGTVSDNASVSVELSSELDSSDIVYRMSDRVWVGLDDGSEALVFSSTYTDARSNETDYGKIISNLTESGFSEIKTLGGAPSVYSADAVSVQYFSADNISCNLRNDIDAASEDEASYYISVKCADKSSFDKNVATTRPFSEVYPTDGDDVLFGAHDAQDSGTEGYKSGKVVVSNLIGGNVLVAEFYQTPDESWHFFATPEEQGKIACDKYNTDDLKRAFLGFTCWDASSSVSSFVQEDGLVFEIIPGAQG